MDARVGSRVRIVKGYGAGHTGVVIQITVLGKLKIRMDSKNIESVLFAARNEVIVL